VDPTGAHTNPHLARDPEIVATADAIAAAGLFPSAGEDFARMTRQHDIWTQRWVEEIKATYKSGSADWRRWMGSLYADASTT
jgi:hypothetical protein